MLAIHRILVPIDFSEHARSALDHARAFAELHEAELELLHVIEEPTFPSLYNVAYAEVYGRLPDLEQQIRSSLQQMSSDVNAEDVQRGVGYHVRKGAASNEIVEYAVEHDIDLIVMASHGLSGLERLVVGSVAKRVIAKAPCPVLIVHAFGKSLVREEAEALGVAEEQRSLGETSDLEG